MTRRKQKTTYLSPKVPCHFQEYASTVHCRFSSFRGTSGTDHMLTEQGSDSVSKLSIRFQHPKQDNISSQRHTPIICDELNAKKRKKVFSVFIEPVVKKTNGRSHIYQNKKGELHMRLNFDHPTHKRSPPCRQQFSYRTQILISYRYSPKLNVLRSMTNRPITSSRGFKK